MANLTITIDGDVLQRARVRALEQGTSVNALLRDYLNVFALENPQVAAIDAVLEIAATCSGGSGPNGRTWTRDELYER